MSTPTTQIPNLPHWYPNLSGESHEVQLAHKLMFQTVQAHEQAITLLSNQVTALQTQVKAQGGT